MYTMCIDRADLNFSDTFEHCFENNSKKLANFNARVSLILNVDVSKQRKIFSHIFWNFFFRDRL